MLTTHLLTYGNLAERQREQLRLLLNYMSRCNEKRDQHWWKLPLCAYEGELRSVFLTRRMGCATCR